MKCHFLKHVTTSNPEIRDCAAVPYALTSAYAALKWGGPRPARYLAWQYRLSKPCSTGSKILQSRSVSPVAPFSYASLKGEIEQITVASPVDYLKDLQNSQAIIRASASQFIADFQFAIFLPSWRTRSASSCGGVTCRRPASLYYRRSWRTRGAWQCGGETLPPPA